MNIDKKKVELARKEVGLDPATGRKALWLFCVKRKGVAWQSFVWRESEGTG